MTEIYTYTNDQLKDFWNNHGGRDEFFKSPYYEILNENELFNVFVDLIKKNQLMRFALFLQENNIIAKIFEKTKMSMKYSTIGLWWYMTYAVCEHNVEYNLMPGKTWTLNIPMEPFDIYLTNTLPTNPYNTYNDPFPTSN